MPKNNGQYSEAQKKIAAIAPPYDKITGADFKKLRQNGNRKPKMS